MVLLDQEDLRREELYASLVDINITTHSDTAYEKGQCMKEENRANLFVQNMYKKRKTLKNQSSLHKKYMLEYVQ